MTNGIVHVGLRSGGVVTINVDKLEVNASQLTLEDVAHGLAGLPRFSNQLHRPVSVAEHSYLGTLLLPNDTTAQLQFLLHDCAEAVGFGDTHGGLKRCLADYTDMPSLVEEAIQEAVYKRLNVDYPLLSKVIGADRAMGAVEYTTLHPAKQRLADAGYVVPPVSADWDFREVIRHLSLAAPTPRQAFDKFVGRWHEIKAERDLIPFLARRILDDLRQAPVGGWNEVPLLSYQSGKLRHPLAVVSRAVDSLVADRLAARTPDGKVVAK